MSFLHVHYYITNRNCISIINLEISKGSKNTNFFGGSYSPNPALAASFKVSRSHLVLHTTVGRIPFDRGSDCHRNLHLTINNTYDKYSCPRRNSNTQPQQASGRRSTPYRQQTLYQYVKQICNVPKLVLLTLILLMWRIG
jgi:hypothetical protein